MTYRIEVVRDRCIGSKNCVHCAPAVFQLDEETIAVVVDPHGEPPEVVREAASVCPVDAILLFDEQTGAAVKP